MLVGHYKHSPPDGMTIQDIDDWRERKLRPTQDCVLMCLTAWLEDYNMLNEEPDVARQLQEFLSHIQEPSKLALAARVLQDSLSKLVSHS
jgi:son of sevenless-like protein